MIRRRLWALSLTTLLSSPLSGETAAASLEGKLATIEGFIDGVMASQLAEGDLVGATVALVKDDRLVLAKGYGLVNRDLGTAVDPATSLFRIGSVSKVLVWLAVMQEVEIGRLALDADVNDYLETFEIPLTQPGPITLQHLMTHTPGFEDRVLGLFARGPRTMGDFHQRLITMQPRRVMPAGQLMAYSNYGAALAAHLVERTSGIAWDDYVDQRVFQPLGMVNATTRQPVPDDMRGQLADGYVFKDGRYESVGFEFIVLPPAGSASVSGTDMARLMVALLKRDTALLAPRSFERLFAAGFTHDERLNGIAHGFLQADSHGQRILGHGGDTLAFHSQLLLYLDQSMGLFVSYNSDRGQKAVANLVRALNDHLFGLPSVAPIADRVLSTERYRGFYLMARSDESSPAKLIKLLSAIPVRSDEEGFLLLPGEHGPRRFYEVDENLFQELDGPERIAFRIGDDKATHLFIDSVAPIAFVRAEGLDHPLFNLGVVLGALVILVAMLVWPLTALTHRQRGRIRGETLASLVAFANGALLVGFVVGFAGHIQGPADALFGLPKAATQLMWLPVIAAVMVLPQFYFVYRAWVTGYWWMARRVHYTLVAFAVLALVVWMHRWHLTAIVLVA